MEGQRVVRRVNEGGWVVTHGRKGVSQARFLNPAKEESGHHPIHNSYLHCQQISVDELNTCATKPVCTGY